MYRQPLIKLVLGIVVSGAIPELSPKLEFLLGSDPDSHPYAVPAVPFAGSKANSFSACSQRCRHRSLNLSLDDHQCNPTTPNCTFQTFVKMHPLHPRMSDQAMPYHDLKGLVTNRRRQ